jgi:alanine dehydrogenase
MPGAVPRTASQALSAAILPYVKRLCEAGWEQHADLRNGVNIRDGRIDNPLIAQAMANHSDTTRDK